VKVPRLLEGAARIEVSS